MKTLSVPPLRPRSPSLHTRPKDPHLLPLPGEQRYRRVNRFIESNRRPHRGRSSTSRPPRVRPCRQKRPSRCRNLRQRPKPVRHRQFARPLCHLSRNARRIFHHHAGRACRKLGQSQLRRRPRTLIRRISPSVPAKKRISPRRHANSPPAATPSSSNRPPSSISSVFSSTISLPPPSATSAPA